MNVYQLNRKCFEKTIRNWIFLRFCILFSPCFCQEISFEFSNAFFHSNFDNANIYTKDVWNSNLMYGMSFETSHEKKTNYVLGYNFIKPHQGFHLNIPNYNPPAFKRSSTSFQLHSFYLGYGVNKKVSNTPLFFSPQLLLHGAWVKNNTGTDLGFGSASTGGSVDFQGDSQAQFFLNPKLRLRFPIGEYFTINTHVAYMYGLKKIQNIEYEFSIDGTETYMGTGYLTGGNWNYGIGLSFDFEVLDN